MKSKKIISTVVASAMAISTMAGMSVMGVNAADSANLLSTPVEIADWSVNQVFDLSNKNVPTNGSAYVTIEGTILDSTTYANVKISNNSWTGVYEAGIGGDFSFDLALTETTAAGFNFQGYNVEYTSVVLHTNDAPVSVVRKGYQEVQTGAAGANDRDVATGVALDWSTEYKLPDTALAGLRYDGTESVVVSSTVTGNVQAMTSDWSKKYFDGGIWNAGGSVEIPLTSEMKTAGIIFAGSISTSTFKIVDNGSKAVRYLVEVPEAAVKNATEATVTIRKADNTTATIAINKAYKAVKAGGNTVTAADGNVFISVAIKDVPGSFAFLDAVVALDGARVATITNY